MAEVHGSCDDRFAAVREALQRNLDGEELGASVAVDLDGETVVDLWGGYRDEARTAPWTQDTIVNGWSTTKTVLSLSALMLVERGDLDVHAPVADYWPEFVARGKRDVEVRHLLSHTSGVVFEQQSDGVDLVLGERFRFGIGFCLGSPLIPYVPEGRTFYWGGWGGSLIVMDLDRRLTISYVMNRMAPGILGSDRSESYVRAVYDALD